MPVDTAVMCVAQCWITREKKEEFHRCFPTHGMLSRVIEAAIDKAIEEKHQQMQGKEQSYGSGYAETRSTQSKVQKSRTGKNAKGRRD